MTTSKTTCYRVQPRGKGIDGWKSETSNGELDRGPHVFGSVSELANGVQGWVDQRNPPEVVEIKCDAKTLHDNGDYEGYVLIGKGEIVRRREFKSWNALIAWAKTDPETL